MPVSPKTSERVCCSASDAARARGRRGRLLGLAWLMLGVGCGDGCRSEPDRPITFVDIVDRTKTDPLAAAKLDRPQLEEAIKEAMELWPGFSFREAKPDEAEWQLDVLVWQITERSAVSEGEGAPAPPAGHVRRSVGTGLELRSLNRGKDSRRYQVEGLVARNVPRSVSFDQLARESVLEAAEDLRFALELQDASPAKVLAGFTDADVERRNQAVAAAGERKLKQAVQPLTDIVRDESAPRATVLKAIGALVQIGDPSAVGALIDAGRRRPAGYLQQLLFAIGQLGGREAEAYLFTVQSGHPDPRLRGVAEEALRELERRRLGGSGGPVGQ